MYYSPTSHKATTVGTLTRRAQFVCDTHNSLTNKTRHLNTASIKNKYSTDFIQCNTHVMLEDSSNSLYRTTATISVHIRDLAYYDLTASELHTITNPCSLNSTCTLNIKDKNKPEDRPGAVCIRSNGQTDRPFIYCRCILPTVLTIIIELH